MSDVIEDKIKGAREQFGLMPFTWQQFLQRFPDYASVTPDSHRSERAMYQWLRYIHGPHASQPNK